MSANNITFILHKPQLSENIGACARGMKNFNFQKFYNALSDKNFLIYPGKLTVADTFRIGCIGNLNDQDMKDTLVAVKEVISDLKINL